VDRPFGQARMGKGKWPKISRNDNPLNAELNPICNLLALLGGVIIVVVSWIYRTKNRKKKQKIPEMGFWGWHVH
jgi:hypothetical protein